MGRKVNVSEVIGKSKLNGFMYGVIAIGVIMILFDGYDMGVWAGTLTSLRTDTGIEDVTLGFITSAGQFGSMLGGIFFGMLSDRIGRKTSLLLATGIYSVFTGLIGIASSPEALTVFKLASGFGLAGFTPVVMTYLSEYTPIKSRALVTTMAISCVSVGSIISTAVCMGVLQTWGWRPLYFIALVPIILFPLIALKMPDSPAHYVKTGKTDKVRNVLEKADPSFIPEPDDEYVVSDEEKAEKPSVIEALKGIFANGMGKYTILFWIVFMLTMYTSFTMQTWLARLMVYGGYGLTNSLFFLLLFNLCSLPAAAIVGWIADKVGFKKTIICLAIFIAVVISVIGFVRSEIVVIILCVIAGAGTTGVYNAVYSCITLSYPAEVRGTGVGWANAIGRFGAMVGPAVAGALVTGGLPVTVIFPVTAVGYLLVGILFFFYNDKLSKQA